MLADYGRADARFKRMYAKVDPNAPWDAADAEALDAETFESWIKRTARTKTAREALALGIRGVFSVEPADLSVLHVLFYAASAGGWDDLLDTEGGAQQDRIVGGSQLITLGMAEELGDRVRLRAPVALDQGRGGRRDRRRSARPARDRRAAAGARRPPRLRARRCRPSATSSPSGCRWAR